MRSNESMFVTQNNFDGSNAMVGGYSYNGYVTNGSYLNYLAQPVVDDTYASSIISPNSAQGDHPSSYPSSTRKRSMVGRKPPKGPDGIRRYSSRRATFERRDRINSRERDRMHQLCDAFERLRQVLPFKRWKHGPHRQRLSKISTLVLAQNYIRALEVMLQESPDDTPTSSTADLEANGFIMPQSNNQNQSNVNESTYFHVSQTGELENNLTTLHPTFNTDQINPSYQSEYFKTESTTQCQY
nr:neurogenic differentiation factor 6-like [Lytechinus pictus]